MTSGEKNDWIFSHFLGLVGTTFSTDEKNVLEIIVMAIFYTKLHFKDQ